MSNFKTFAHEKQVQRLDATNLHFNKTKISKEESEQDLNKTNMKTFRTKHLENESVQSVDIGKTERSIANIVELQ